LFDIFIDFFSKVRTLFNTPKFNKIISNNGKEYNPLLTAMLKVFEIPEN